MPRSMVLNPLQGNLPVAAVDLGASLNPIEVAWGSCESQETGFHVGFRREIAFENHPRWMAEYIFCGLSFTSWYMCTALG